MAKRKQISAADLMGDMGVALIHRIVLRMGFVWNATKLEAGIDGYIEIRDATTAEVSNCILQVQSKAGPSWFTAEDATSFVFHCDERDLNYWINGNAPVILVVSRPQQDEAYWVSIKDYFRDPQRRKERRIRFDKQKDVFDESCRNRLAELAIPTDSGIYLSAAPIDESLVLNFLPLVAFPPRLFRASTKLQYPRQVWAALRKRTDQPPAEWILHGGFLYAFQDLTFLTWSAACLAQSTENLSSDQWSRSADRDQRYVFVRLLYQCLDQLLRRQRIRYSPDDEYYFVTATPELSERKIGGLSAFKGYESKTTAGRTAYYRHRAMEALFVRFDGVWYLEITPTYRFTHDGVHRSRFSEERLRGIKMLERQNSVHLRHLRMWEEVLLQKHLQKPTRAPARQLDLFATTAPLDEDQPVEPYDVIQFGSLPTLNAPFGVPEAAWLPSEVDRPGTDDDAAERLFDL